MKALIDGDILVYRCGFAAEKKWYLTSEGNFRYKKEVPKGATIYEVEKTIEPVENALTNVKTVITDIGKQLAEKLSVDKIDIEVYLTGQGNFRDALATIKPYKGNRDSDHKPHWYTEIQEYMIKVWGAEVVDGIEADDILADLQNEETCIVSTDKDLDQVIGWHYNWVKSELYYIGAEQAKRLLYKQILTGDSTDNIEGIPGCGNKTADKILEGVIDYEEAVRDAYENFFEGSAKGSEKCNQYQMTWEEILKENRALVTLGKSRGSMSELFALLVGICSINYCSFSVEHREDGDWLAVSVYDKRSEILDRVYFDVSALEFDIIIREQLKLKPNFSSCLGKTMVTNDDNS